MIPICVDLDGTLIQNDLVSTSIKSFVKRYPYKIFHVLFWFLKGFPYLKCKIAQFIPIDVKALTYNTQLIEWLKSKQNPLYLVTGSPQNYADQINEFVPLYFQEVFGATPSCRLTGLSKANFLKKKFSFFIYIGNSHADIYVWKYAKEIVGVNVPNKVKKWIEEQNKPYIIF